MARVADFIERNRAFITQQFAAKAGLLASARALTPNEVIDTLPEYLATLVALSRRGRHAEATDTKRRLEETHISHRLRVGFHQDEVTSEYVLLGRILTGLWEGLSPEEQPPPEDLLLLHGELEGALEHVIAIFSGYTVETRQAEKRALRRMDALATALLEEAPAGASLEARLSPLLEVVQEAMGAEAAALFLADAARERLLPTATSGRWRDLEERDPVPVDGPSYVGQLARAEEPLLLPDAGHPALPVSEGVRRSGVRSLLGLRLWPQGRLLGVVLVGYPEVRPLDPQTRRYFETLTEYLSGIIQNARLLEEVRATSARLRESEARYRLATLATSDAIWEWDVAADRLHWSEGVRELFGYAPSELGDTPGSWSDRIHPQERERVLRAFQGLVRGGGTRWGSEYRFRHRDGHYVYITDHGVVERDGSGRAVRVVGAMRNVTERKRAEEAVRAAQQRQERSEALLRTVVEVLPVGVLVADETGRLILSNAAVRRIWAGERLVGREDYSQYQGWWYDTGAPISPEEWGISRALDRGEASGGEFARIRAFDGTEKVIRISSAPLREADGRVFGAIALNEDVTHLKEVEEALQKSEREYRTLTESIAHVVWTARPDGALDYLNQTGADYIGVSAEEALGARWQDLVHPEDLPAALERWSRSLATGELYQIEQRLRRRDGAYAWFLTRAVPLRGPDGRPVKWFGTATDIEDLKRAEAELRRRAEFEQQLVGIVSHDLRNPLNAILLSTVTLLRRHTLDARQQAIISRIQASAERAIRMIRDLLDFTQARMGTGIPIQRRPTSLHELSRQVVDELQLTHPGRRVEVVTREDARGEWDPDRVAQVISNLVSNALRYSPEGTPVCVTTRGEGEGVVLEVHNGGAPIPASFLPRLFEPLERGEGQRGRSERSIGLGLFIVRSIVQAHGGTVEVHSSAEAGTTFTVRLPRSPRPAAPAEHRVH